MQYDEVIQEVWRIKEEIAAQYDYDVHKYAQALREKRSHYKGKNSSSHDSSTPVDCLIDKCNRKK